MKLACSSSAYRDAFTGGRIDLREWLRACAEDMQLDGVELAYDHFVTAGPEYVRDVKRLCVDLHLTIAGIVVDNDFGPEETRAAEVTKVQRASEIAAVLGAPIVTVLGSSVPANRATGDEGRIVGLFRKVFGEKQANPRAIWSDMTYALRQCAEYASARAVVLALQNGQRHGLVADVFQLERALHDTGSPWLRGCLDPAELAERRGMDRVLPQTVQLRARFRQVQDDGSDRGVRWPEVLRILQMGRYRGFVSIDYDGVEQPETAVPRAARFLQSALHLIDRQQLLTSPGAASANGASGDAGGVAERMEAPSAAR